MDRCKLFSKLTRSNDENCMLFEELLESFFEEYTSLYGGLQDRGVVNDVSDITCVGNIDGLLKVSVSFGNQSIDEQFADDLEDYIRKQSDAYHSVEVQVSGGDTILIEIKKG